MLALFRGHLWRMVDRAESRGAAPKSLGATVQCYDLRPKQLE